MAKVWVLDTETKGTGAQMVPLEKVLRQPHGEREPLFVPRKRTTRPEPEPEPRAPYRFKVVDVMTRRVLVDDAGTQETVEALRDIRSIVDVQVSVWEPTLDKWRSLTLTERRMLWSLRDEFGSGSPRSAQSNAL